MPILSLTHLLGVLECPAKHFGELFGEFWVFGLKGTSHVALCHSEGSGDPTIAHTGRVFGVVPEVVGVSGLDVTAQHPVHRAACKPSVVDRNVSISPSTVLPVEHLPGSIKD